MSYKEALYADLKKHYGLPDDAVITSIEEDVEVFRGCDTCGHNSGKDFSVDFTYEVDGVRRWKSVSGSLADFLSSL